MEEMLKHHGVPVAFLRFKVTLKNPQENLFSVSLVLDQNALRIQSVLI